MHLDSCHCSGGCVEQLIAPGAVKESHETEGLLRVSCMGFDVMDIRSQGWQLNRSSTAGSCVLNAVLEVMQVVQATICHDAKKGSRPQPVLSKLS